MRKRFLTPHIVISLPALVLILFASSSLSWAQSGSGKEGVQVASPPTFITRTVQQALPDGDQPSLDSRGLDREPRINSGFTPVVDFERLATTERIYKPVWQVLDRFELNDKKNALIEFELSVHSSQSVLAEIEYIKSLK